MTRTITTIEELRELPVSVVLQWNIQRLWPGEPAGLEFGRKPDHMGHTAEEVPLPIKVLHENGTPA